MVKLIGFSTPRCSVSRIALALLLAAAPALACAGQLEIPLRLGGGYFEHLAAKKIFTDPDQTFVAWNDGTGCNHLVLSNHRVTGEPRGIRMTMDADGRAGTPVGNLCVPLFPWEGEVDVLLRPVVGKDRKTIELRIADSNARNARGETELSGKIWNWTKEYVHPRLASLEIDISGPLSEVRNIATMLLPREDSGHMERALASLTVARTTTNEQGLTLVLNVDVDAGSEFATIDEPALTIEELARVHDVLLKWDVLVTLAAKQAATYTADVELRDTLLAELLNTRYEIVWILETAVPGSEDPVRGLFLDTWTRLAPLLREISIGIPDDTALDFAAFISALDALQAIDAAGPGLNIDVSVDGLRRLARLIAPPGPGDPLFYNEGVDPELRELFDFGEPVALPTPPPSSGSGWLIGNAQAQPTMAEIARWLPRRRNIREYLERVHELLDEVGKNVADQKDLEEPYRAMFGPLVLASAWQETCWRQFTVQDGKQKPLKSSVGAVGIMQVLPRVWRGFYQPNPLNWDIAYNATAGAEILHHYLVHYAIRKQEHQKGNGLENLPRATYSAYHGGPRHLTRYRKKDTSPKLKRIDDSFWKKYETVRSGNPMAVQQCYH